MGRKVLLDMPEKVYKSLAEAAEVTGQPPEEYMVEILTSVTQNGQEDPFEKHIGAYPTNIPGWGDRHDQYIGEAVLRPSVGNKPGNGSDA